MQDRVPNYKGTNLDIVGWMGANSVDVVLMRDWAWAIRCPWASSHSGDDDMATIEQTDGWPVFKCEDSKCKNRNFNRLVEVYENAPNFCKSFIVNEPGLVIGGDPDFKPDYEILPLGVTREGRYFYQCSPQGHVVSLTHGEHKEMGFYHLVPDYAFWAHECQRRDDRTKMDWKRAALKWMALCKAKGEFDTTRLRGSGVWWDDGRVVVNLGDSLLVDGKKRNLFSIKSRFIYERSAQIPSEGVSALATDAELQSIYEMACGFSFQNKYGPVVATGISIVGMMPFLFEWRPHAWLSGQPGSGKSFCSNRFFRALWEPCGGLIQSTDTTAAGIRESVGRRVASVVIDDQRPGDTTQSINRLQDIIAMARGASTSFGGRVSHGSDKGGRHAVIKGCFVVNSVEYPVTDQQDRERFFNLRCSKEKQPPQPKEFERRVISTITAEFASRVFTRAVMDAKDIMLIVGQFVDALWSVSDDYNLSRRYCDQWGTVLGAAWWSMNPGREASLEEAVGFFKDHYIKEEYEMDVMAEEEGTIGAKCLQEILRFIPQGEKRSVGEVIEDIIVKYGMNRDGRALPPIEREMAPETWLGRLSMRVEGGWLWVGSSDSRLKTVCSKVGVQNYVSALATIPGAQKRNILTSFAGHRAAVRAEIPLAAFRDDRVTVPKLGDLPWD